MQQKQQNTSKKTSSKESRSWSSESPGGNSQSFVSALMNEKNLKKPIFSKREKALNNMKERARLLQKKGSFSLFSVKAENKKDPGLFLKGKSFPTEKKSSARVRVEVHAENHKRKYEYPTDPEDFRSSTSSGKQREKLNAVGDKRVTPIQDKYVVQSKQVVPDKKPKRTDSELKLKSVKIPEKEDIFNKKQAEIRVHTSSKVKNDEREKPAGKINNSLYGTAKMFHSKSRETPNDFEESAGSVSAEKIYKENKKTQGTSPKTRVDNGLRKPDVPEVPIKDGAVGSSRDQTGVLPKSEKKSSSAGGEESMWISFDAGSLAVSSNFHELIREHATRFLSRMGSGSLFVSGYAHPSDKHSDEQVVLSMSRVASVVGLLEKFGVGSHRIVRIGQGGAPPNFAGESKNSCVEIRMGVLERRQTVWSQRPKKSSKREEVQFETVDVISGDELQSL